MKKSNNHSMFFILSFFFIAGFYSILFFHSNSKPVIPELVIENSLKYWLHESPRNVNGNIEVNYPIDLDSLYIKTNYSFIWFNQYKLTQAGQALLSSLKNTSGDYWKVYGYRVRRLEYDLELIYNSPQQVAALDILLSDAFISYSKQVLNKELLPNNGELDHPSFSHVKLPPQKKASTDDVINLLLDHKRNNDLLTLINGFSPQHSGYKQLAAELNRYQKITDSQKWFALEELEGAEHGLIHKEIPRLRWMLHSYGDIKVSDEQLINLDHYYSSLYFDDKDPAYFFDNQLLSGVMNFQKRNGLIPNGIIDKETFKTLNIHPYFISQKIAINMKRWRYLPNDLGKKYILVNMADYHLSVIENDIDILKMKVIIGKNNRRTPVMTSTIGSVILAPEWKVPHRVAINDILPKIKNDPLYLEKNNFKVFEGWDKDAKEVELSGLDLSGFNRKKNTYRLVQLSGDSNSLGSAKFIIPNDKSIYLHDTNKKGLFEYKDRAFSSGCIRVEKPIELVKHLVNNQWNSERILSVINSQKEREIILKKDVPVHLMYWTAWVDNGQLQIRPDVYNRDLINKSVKLIKTI